MKTLKYILSILLILTALFLLALGLIVFPPISNLIKASVKFWKNKTIRYSAYVFLLIISGISINNNSDITPVLNKKKETTLDVKDDKKEKKIKKAEVVQDIWKTDFSHSEILGNWIQVKYYNKTESSKITNVSDGDSEQKELTLTKSKYKTAYPFGSGNNPEYNYSIIGNRLSVVVGKLKTVIYSFQVKMSVDKTKLLLKEKSGLVQVFKRQE